MTVPLDQIADATITPMPEGVRWSTGPVAVEVVVELALERAGVRSGWRPLPAAELVEEADEITWRGRLEEVEVELRHSFDEHWRIRIAARRQPDGNPVRLLARLRISGGTVWCWPGGRPGFVAVLEPGLVFTSPVGVLDEAVAAALELDTGDPAPVTIRGRLRELSALAAGLPQAAWHEHLDSSETLLVDHLEDEVVECSGDAVVFDPPTPTRAEIGALTAGARATLQVHGPRGSTVLSPRWSDPIDLLAPAIAARARAAAVTDPISALLACCDGDPEGLDQAAEVAESLDREDADPWAVLLLLDQYRRRGRPDLARRAVELATRMRWRPGAGVVLTALAAELVAAGADPMPLAAVVSRWLTQEPVGDPVGALERGLLGGPPIDLDTLATSCGAGLPGWWLDPPDPLLLAQLTALTELLPDHDQAIADQTQRIRRRLLHEWQDLPEEALLWLQLPTRISG